MAMENVKKHVQTGNKKHKKTTIFPQKSDINNITQKARQSHFNMTKHSKRHHWQNVGHAKYAINPCMKTHSALS